MDNEVVEENTERLKVRFNPRNTKLVLITKSKEHENELKLEKFVGLNKKSEAHVDFGPEVSLEGLKETIEEFRTY